MISRVRAFIKNKNKTAYLPEFSNDLSRLDGQRVFVVLQMYDSGLYANPRVTEKQHLTIVIPATVGELNQLSQNGPSVARALCGYE